MEYLLYLLGLINLISFIFYGVDKYKAIKQKYRVPEKTLLWLAFLGGSVGAFIAMILFRHKIRKTKFIILVPLFFFVEVGLYLLLPQFIG